MTHSWFSRGLLRALVLFVMLGSPALGDELSDWDAFVSQYARIDDLNVFAQGTRSMTVTPYPGMMEEGTAQGPVRFFYSFKDGVGMVRVESDLVALDEYGASLEQRMWYAYNGEIYSLYDPVINVYETRKLQMLPGVWIPVNPALYPVGLLRRDMLTGMHKHPGHFRDTEKLRGFIRSRELVRDDEGDLCLELRLHEVARENESPLEELDRYYRVYMTAEHPSTERMLPKRMDMFERGALVGTISLGEYAEVAGARGPVLLPKRVSLVVWEDEAPIVEYSAYVDRYTTESHERSFFVIEPPSGVNLVDGDEGTIVRPDGSEDRYAGGGVTEEDLRITSESSDSTPEDQAAPKRTYGSLVMVLIGAVVVIAVTVVIYRTRR